MCSLQAGLVMENQLSLSTPQAEPCSNNWCWEGGTVGAVSDMMNMEFFINVTGITLTVTAS